MDRSPYASAGFAPPPTASLAATAALASADLDDSLNVTGQTHRAGQQSQQQIDRLASQTDALLNEYQRLLQQSDYQQAYNKELQQRLLEQSAEIRQLTQSLADAQITRLHILPLLREMTLALKQFIQLDLPFEQQPRLASIDELEQLLANSNVSIAEKYRRVMQAWQIESDYSYNIDSYRSELQLEGSLLSAQFLRVGRTALYVQTLDGKRSAVWNSQKNQWLLLPPGYNSSIAKGIRMAKQHSPPELLALPVHAQSMPQQLKP